MFSRSRALWFSGIFLSFTLSADALAQNASLRTELFAQTDQAMAGANDSMAHILAPASYEQAAEHYRAAELALERGRNLENIRRDLAEATRHFNEAVEATKLAAVTLRDALAAREDAEMAEAPRFAATQWQEAEVEFAEAARILEDGNLNRARRAGETAEMLYRDTELVAIEANYLSGARQLISVAQRERVDRYAPNTLAKAEGLLSEAETRLRNDRYDTDYPRSLAREANYEARHAIYLANRIRAMSDRDLSAESLLLEAETPVTRIAGELDIVAELDEGFDRTTAEIIAVIESLADDRERLTQRDDRIAFLEDELASLEARLGDESERRKLQEQIQLSFDQLASVFTREEATVLRRGDEIIVRMGLNFDVGSDVIRPEYFALLRKIQTAIDVFPESRVEIQGHTDSFGADATNLALSERRANAVQQYLLANIDARGAGEIAAVGYGETVPLANNETPEGRARNRRIDLLIQPNFEALTQRLATD